MNVPDHEMTFQSLSELLQQSVTPFVASVQAKECGGERSFAFAGIPLSCVTNMPTYMTMAFFFSIEAFDEEGPGEVNGHCCNCG